MNHNIKPLLIAANPQPVSHSAETGTVPNHLQQPASAGESCETQKTPVVMHPLHNVKEGKINTLGGVVDLIDPNTEAVLNLETIANALGLICRFGGHLTKFYSVAQHSLLVAYLAPEELRREALMHDAHEAYIMDVPSPIKHLLGSAYRHLEYRWVSAFARLHFLDAERMATLKLYDLLACEIEHAIYQCGVDPMRYMDRAPSWLFIPMLPAEASSKWLEHVKAAGL